MSKTVQDLINEHNNVDNIDDTTIIDNINISKDDIEKVDDFIVTFNAPTIVDTRLIFSATITSEAGVMFNGNIQPFASVENEDARTVKSILETIKADTKAAINQLAINKDWYK